MILSKENTFYKYQHLQDIGMQIHVPTSRWLLCIHRKHTSELLNHHGNE